ncbi:MRC2 protein, partial [Amia calva]|nr:MRC2 protein [Amia calva]
MAGGNTPNGMWIGLYRETQNWHWSNGQEIIYSNWRTPLFCALSNAEGNWEDKVCYETNPFMCFTADRMLLVSQRCQYFYMMKTWNDAQAYCQNINKDLPTIYNIEELQQLLSLIGSLVSIPTWVGLYHDQNNWQWSSEEALIYSNWKTQLFCAAVNPTGNWLDLNCNEVHPFVCYTETSQPSQRYTLVPDEKSWADAQSYCRAHHTDLVSIGNQGENEAVRESAPNTVFWIGLFNDPWKWSDGGNSTFRLWNPNEPNNWLGAEKCVQVLQGKMNDGSCATPLPFFCYEEVREMILVQQTKTWEEAMDYCRAYYTDLTSIVSQFEQNLAAPKTMGAQTSHVWLGLRQSLISRSWFWVNREPLQYENWKQGRQPQCPQSSYCGAMSTVDHLWVDRPCDERLNFICFKGTAPHTLHSSKNSLQLINVLQTINVSMYSN